MDIQYNLQKVLRLVKKYKITLILTISLPTVSGQSYPKVIEISGDTLATYYITFKQNENRTIHIYQLKHSF